jgi:thioredoxin-related protein
MKRLKTLVAMTALALVLAGLAGAPAAAGGIDWLDYQSALAAQKKQAKPMLVYFHLSYCYRCKEMKRKVFSQPEVISRLNTHFINAKVDLEKDPATGQLYQADYTPSYLFLNARGKQVFRTKGVMGPERFLKMLSYVQSKAYLNQSWDQYQQGN